MQIRCSIPIKGKSVELPDVTVIEATADSLKVAVSEDAVQSGTPDFVFTMKEPLKTVPNPKDKITLSGNLSFVHTDTAAHYDE